MRQAGRERDARDERGADGREAHGMRAVAQAAAEAAAAPLTPERREKYRNRFFRVWGYIGIGAICVFACWLLGHVSDALIVLLAGSVMAFIYAPIVNALDRRFHVPRTLGTFIGLFVLVAVVVLLVGSVIPIVVSQVTGLLQALPGYFDAIMQAWDDLSATLGSDSGGALQMIVSSLLDSVSSQASSLGGQIARSATSSIFSGIGNVVQIVIDVFMAIVVSFWLAKDFPSMETEISTVVGPRRGEDYRVIASVFGRSMGGYLRGIIINSACTGAIAGVGFWILGVPYALLLGIITAFLNIIPYIGPWTGGAIAFLVAISVSPTSAVLSIVVTVVAQQFTDNIISPKVMQTAVSLHPVLVILALTAGGSVGGVIGMIFAVPLAAAIKGTFVYYFEKRTGRQLVSREGSLFRGEPFCDEEGNPRPACDALGMDLTNDENVPERIRKAMNASSTGTFAAVAQDGSDGSPATPEGAADPGQAPRDAGGAPADPTRKQ